MLLTRWGCSARAGTGARIRDRGHLRLAVACGIAARLLVVAGLAAGDASEQSAAVSTAAPATVAVATDRFVLVTTPRRFVVRSVSG